MKRLRELVYHEPRSVEEAVMALVEAGDGAYPLAGGTDLIVDMKMDRLRPAAVVNLKRIPGLAEIETTERGTRIGALTRVGAIAASDAIRARHPALAEAAGVLAPEQVRHLATIGGNVGRASPASDLGPPLIVHRAVASITGPDGQREEPVEGLYAGPGRTSLDRTDLITSFFIPATPGFGSAHRKIGARATGTDIAIVGVCAGVRLAGGRIVEARIALASVGPTPMRARDAEAGLVGAEPDDPALGRAGDDAAAECRPISDLRAGAAYRTELVRVLTVRALRAAVASAGEASR